MLALIKKKAISIVVGLLIALSIHTISVIAIAPPSIQTQITQTQKSPSASNEAAIRQKLQRWRELFSQEQFSLKGYENLFVNTDELLVYDSYSPSGYDREIRGWNNYRNLWEKYIPIDFPKWKVINLDVTRLETQGDYGWSAISYIGRGVRNGAEYFGGQHGTHVWKRINGDWRIVHEHLTEMNEREVQTRRQRANTTQRIYHTRNTKQ